MKKRWILFFTTLGIFSQMACSDFLKEYSQNMAYVETLTDLDELLIGEVYFSQQYNNGYDPAALPIANSFTSLASSRFIQHFLMDDDVAEYVAGIEGVWGKGSDKDWVRYQGASAFYWQADPYLDYQGVPYTVNSWTDFYHRIAAANSILSQLDEVETPMLDTTKLRVEGEARFLRAAYYFSLINTYAQPYSSATADEEPGVPLKTNAEVEDRFFARSSVKDVYNLIIDDLERALVCLKEYSPFPRPVRTNYAAAATLLSRVYLYIEEYELAIKAAGEAIASPYFSLLDLNTHDMNTSFSSLTSPEVLFSQSGTFMAMLHQNDSINIGDMWVPVGAVCGNGYTTSMDLYNLYEENDLRKQAFFVPRHFGKDTYRCLKVRVLDDNVIGEDHVIRLAEAYLNKAEAEAILGKDSDAKKTLNDLLLRRYASGKVPVLAQVGEELVNYIRDERRKELCYEGHRWFDLRRYAVNSKYPFTKEIVHVSYEYISTSETEGYFREAGKYVLKPYPEDKEAYVLPLPDYAVLFNEGVLVQNPDRPERAIQPL